MIEFEYSMDFERWSNRSGRYIMSSIKRTAKAKDLATFRANHESVNKSFNEAAQGNNPTRFFETPSQAKRNEKLQKEADDKAKVANRSDK